MRTEDLITLLSQAPQAKPPLRLTWALAALVSVLVLGFRPDIGAPPPTMLHKSLLLLSVLIVVGGGLIRASQQVAWQSWGLYPVAAAVTLAGRFLLTPRIHR